MPNHYINTTGRKDVGKYNEQVHEVAFELWWLECSRDPCQVAVRLKDDPIARELAGLGADDISPSDDSIRRWSISEEWSDEAYRRMAEAMPNMLAKGSVELIYSFPEAVRTLTNIASGKGSGNGGKPDASDRIAADNAFRVVQLIAGDKMAEMARPVVSRAIDLSEIESWDMERLMEAERGMLPSG